MIFLGRVGNGKGEKMGGGLGCSREILLVVAIAKWLDIHEKRRRGFMK